LCIQTLGFDLGDVSKQTYLTNEHCTADVPSCHSLYPMHKVSKVQQQPLFYYFKKHLKTWEPVAHACNLTAWEANMGRIMVPSLLRHKSL
jgi:hypothetical protein